MPKVSVIISTYGKERSNQVLACIESLRKQTLKPHEIILALDQDDELLAFYRSVTPSYVSLVSSDGRGLSRARNAGVRRATGEVVAFTDDDAVADLNWLRNLVANFERPDVVGAGGFIVPVWKSGRPIWFPEELDWVVGCSYKGLPETKSYVRNTIGCNMSFKRDVFEKVGYFQSYVGRVGKKLTGSEEAEFSVRLLRKIPKSRIVYDPTAVVYHNIPLGRKTIRFFVKRSFYEGYSKGLLKQLEPDSRETLWVERNYLRYLFGVSTYSRLKRAYEWKSLLQLFALFLCVFTVLTGYLIGNSRILRIDS